MRLVTLSLLLIGAASLIGCSNTLEGIGQDIEDAGQSIQRTF